MYPYYQVFYSSDQCQDAVSASPWMWVSLELPEPSSRPRVPGGHQLAFKQRAFPQRPTSLPAEHGVAKLPFVPRLHPQGNQRNHPSSYFVSYSLYSAALSCPSSYSISFYLAFSLQILSPWRWPNYWLKAVYLNVSTPWVFSWYDLKHRIIFMRLFLRAC